MPKGTELIVDQNGIEILVGYDYDATNGYYEEPGNIATYVSPMILTELETVEVVIKGVGINILPLLNEKQKSFIISKLNYES